MSVTVGPDPLVLPFQPEVAIGVVQVPAGTGEASAIRIIHRAEQLALQALDEPERVLQRRWGGQPPTPMAVAPCLAETQPAAL